MNCNTTHYRANSSSVPGDPTLGEIERVCTSLIAIDAGKLQYAGPVSAFTERIERLRIDVDDDPAELVAALQARGLEVDAKGSEIHVVLTGDSVYDIVRDVAADLEMPLSRLEVMRHRLEELFRTPAGAGRG